MSYGRGFPEGFPDRLIMAMEIRDISKRKLAKITRCDRRSIYSYCYGDTSPSTATFARICIALKVSADWLLFGRGEAPYEDKRDQG